MALNINGTTGISGVDGSASAPALQGTDSNTGINFASDTVNINTGGSTRATVDSNGTFLVGATSYGGGGNNPALFVSSSSANAVKFHKTGSGQSSLQLTCDSGTGTGQGNNAGLQITQEGTSSYFNNHDNGEFFMSMGGVNTILHRSNGTIRARSAGVDGSASAPALQGTDSNTGINFASDTVNINTGGSTRATVDSNGTFLVGATSYGGGGNNPALFVSSSSANAVKFHKTGSGQSSLQLTCDSGTGS